MSTDAPPLDRAPLRARVVLASAATVAGMLASAPPARAEAVRSISSHGVRTLGLSAGEAEEMSATIHIALSRRAAMIANDSHVVEQCRGDRQCHCRAARASGADVAFFGNLGHVSDIYTFELVVVDARSCAVDRAVFVSERHDAASAQSRVADLIVDVTTPNREISVTAAKREDRVEQVASPVVVFPRARLRNMGIREIDDLVPLVPGYEALDANWGSTVLHYGLPTTILWMVEGIPLQDAQNPIRSFGRDIRLRLGHFDRVEFVLGPASTLWGPNALLGVANFIAKRPVRAQLEATAALRLATPASAEALVSAAQRQGHFGYSVSAAFSAETTPQSYLLDSPYASIAVSDIPWGNGGLTRPKPDRYADLIARFEAFRRLALVVAASEYRTYWEISPFGPLLDEDHPGFWENSVRLYSASWAAPIVDWLSYELVLSRYEKVVHEDFMFQPARPEGDPDGLRSVQLHPTEPRINNSADARLVARHRLGPIDSQLLVGTSYLYQSVPDSLAEVVAAEQEPGALTVSFTGKTFHTGAAYAHETLTLVNRRIHAAVMGGTRYELRDPLPSGFTSQAGVIAGYDWFRAKLLYSEGFRPPDALRLFSTVGTMGNLDLRPEASQALSAEMIASPVAGVTARIGASFTQLTDLIVQEPVLGDPVFTSRPVNAGSIDISAGYASVDLDLAAQLDATFNVAYKHLEQSAELVDPIPVARFTAGGGLAFWVARDFRAYTHGAVLSRRKVPFLEPTPAPAPGVTEERRLPVDVRATVGIAATNLWRGLELDLSVSNPFRMTHYTPYQVDGRPSFLVEPRDASQVSLELRWSY